MNFKTKTNTVKQTLARVMLIIMISSVLTLVSCKSDGLEAGLIVSDSGCLEINPVRLAYKSDISKFDINDVRLTFYYGYLSPFSGIDAALLEDALEDFRQNSESYPVFELYFSNCDGNSVIIKHIEENLVSKKYLCDWILDENLKLQGFEYNCSEEFTIPQELFTKETGVISLGLFGADTRMNEEEPRELNSIDIYYKKDGDKIILSSEEFSEWWEKFIIY